MDPRPTMPLDLDDPGVVERLVRYDDLPSDELAHLERDPRAAALIARLRSVDRHLAAAQPDDAVAADELFALGGGPGAAPLSPERAAEVQRHLAVHPEERRWTESLGAHPPSPLITDPLDGVDPPGAADSHRPLEGPRPGEPAAERAGGPRIPAWLAWTPLAAAALALAMLLGGNGPRGVFAGGLPDSPILRSGARAPLLFPRGRVLAAPAGSDAFAARPLFEVAPRARGVDAYGFELSRVGRGAGAFGEGAVVWRHEGAAPSATGPTLPPGTYEWRAWTLEDGVERGLGSRSFRVVRGPADLTDAASGEDARTDADAIRGDVCELHAAGFLTDARHRARALPATDARDDYLGRGR